MRIRIAVVLAMILAAVLGLQIGAPDPIRVATMFPFLLLGPGMAWVAINDRVGAGGYAVLAVSVSLAFSILISTLLLFTQLWSPELGFWLLVFAASVGLFVTDK